MIISLGETSPDIFGNLLDHAFAFVSRTVQFLCNVPTFHKWSVKMYSVNMKLAKKV